MKAWKIFCADCRQQYTQEYRKPTICGACGSKWIATIRYIKPKPATPLVKVTIVRNMARCEKCNDTIESKYCHDFVTCKCGAISVDGGKDYLRRVGNSSDFIDLSQIRSRP